MPSLNRALPREVVTIGGAGPAGLAAAITLAKAGRKVIVHEMHKEVGHRFGQDFQGLENWTTKENVFSVLDHMGLSTDFNAPAGDNCTIFDSAGKAYRFKSDQPPFYLVERGPGPGSLDSALLRQAQSLGVEIHFNSRLREIKGQGILAAGPRAADAIAVGYHFETDMENGYWAICDNSLAPAGYAYLLVSDGRGTLKTCMFSDFKHKNLYLKKTIAAFKQRLDLRMRNMKFHGGSGNFYIPHSAYRGRHPLVGEQAGFQDTLWGFGIRLAISSGVLAAQSLLSGENYDKLWYRQLKPQLQTSVVNRAMYSTLNNVGYSWFLGYLASRGNLRNTLRYQYKSTVIKNMLYPLAKRLYQSRRKDDSCHQSDCYCVTCRGEVCIH